MGMLSQRFLAASLISLSLVASTTSSAFAQSEAMALCKEDVARLCPGVAPGGGKIIACLKQHKMEMSVGCAKALQAMKAKMGK